MTLVPAARRVLAILTEPEVMEAVAAKVEGLDEAVEALARELDVMRVLPRTGDYVLASLGCDLANDAVTRQQALGQVLGAFRAGMDGAKPDLIVIAVPNRTGEDIGVALTSLLDLDNDPARRILG